MKPAASRASLFGLLLNPEDRVEFFFRNVGCLLTEYRALYHRTTPVRASERTNYQMSADLIYLIIKMLKNNTISEILGGIV
jgi:hypothetical protein